MVQTFDNLSSQVIAAAIEVHKRLGPGFLETIYERALCLELADRGIPFEAQKSIPVLYGERLVGDHVLDLLVDRRLVVELKAVRALEDIHFVQVKSYLHATGLKVGLLMNFNSQTLDVRRIVLRFEDRPGPLSVPE
jgi:GxxExxY protein